jgi:hypothetical protein
LDLAVIFTIINIIGFKHLNVYLLLHNSWVGKVPLDVLLALSK